MAFSLVIGAREIRGWTSGTVSASLDDVAPSFALDLEGSADVFAGERVQVYADGLLAVDGYLDGREPYAEPEASGLAVYGRGLTADLVDCSAPVRVWRDRRLEAIARDLAEPFGVSVEVLADTGEPVPRCAVDAGQTIAEVLEGPAEVRGVYLHGTRAGALAIWTADAAREASGRLSWKDGGIPPIRVNAREDAAAVFSEYTCRGQRSGNDQDFGAVVAGIQGLALDGGVGRYRPRIVAAPTGATAARCKATAERAAAAALGASAALSVEVQGWTDAAGTLWTPGTLIAVDLPDPIAWSGTFLVAAVDLTVDPESGRRASLRIVPRAAYLPRIPSKARDGLGAWRSPA